MIRVWSVVVNFLRLSILLIVMTPGLGLAADPLEEATLLAYRNSARVVNVLSSTEILGSSESRPISLYEHLIVRSQTDGVGVIGYFVVTEVGVEENKFKAKLLRGSSRDLIRIGDLLVPADLSISNDLYGAKVELMDPQEVSGLVSSRYRSLYTQGVGIGDTASTLKRDEFLIAWYGYLAYGAVDWLTVSSYLPLNTLGASNLQMKARFFKSLETKLAAGINFARVPGTSESVLNFNFMWDSASSSSIISHSYLTMAAISIDNSKDTAAVKSFGASSIQSGYEFLLPNWSRVLAGPNYNFETKALGGYVAYLKIWEHFHFQMTLASSNLSSIKLDVKDGFYGFIDAYWRY